MLKIGVFFFNLKQFYLINFLFGWFYEKKTSQKFEKIHSQRESSDSPGDFRFKRTGEIDRRVIPKTIKTK